MSDDPRRVNYRRGEPPSLAGRVKRPHDRPRVKYVIGPEGSRLTITDLPAPETKRWVARRKAEIIAAVRGGLISLEEACSRYSLTTYELLSWQESYDRHGVRGLRTTGIQQYGSGHRSRAFEELREENWKLHELVDRLFKLAIAADIALAQSSS
jgi:hypothetical protein